MNPAPSNRLCPKAAGPGGSEKNGAEATACLGHGRGKWNAGEWQAIGLLTADARPPRPHPRRTPPPPHRGHAPARPVRRLEHGLGQGRRPGSRHRPRCRPPRLPRWRLPDGGRLHQPRGRKNARSPLHARVRRAQGPPENHHRHPHPPGAGRPPPRSHPPLRRHPRPPRQRPESRRPHLAHRRQHLAPVRRHLDRLEPLQQARACRRRLCLHPPRLDGRRQRGLRCHLGLPRPPHRRRHANRESKSQAEAIHRR